MSFDDYYIQMSFQFSDIGAYVAEHKSSLEAAMELDAGQHHGAPPAFSAIEAEENFPSSSTIETPRTNQQPTPNGGSKDSIGS